MMQMTTQRRARTLAALAAALLALGTAQAAEPPPSNYWGAHLGANTLRDWDARVDFGFGTPFGGRAELQRGLHGGLMAGRQSGHGRYELEYERGQIRVQRLSLGTLSQQVDATGHYDALFANAYRLDRMGENIETFAGGGIGWGRVKLPQLNVGTTCACFGPAEKSGFAWQLRAGVAYRLADDSRIALQYTWLNLPKPERDAAPSVQYERRRFGAITLGYIRPF